MQKSIQHIFAIGICLSLAFAFAAHAQVIPGPADAARVKSRLPETLPDYTQDQRVAIPSVTPSLPIPESAKGIHFTLKEVRIEGMTVFPADEFQGLYASHLGKDVTLDIAWVIAGAITQRYRDAGYFLSRAYVPAQEVSGGVLVIKVVEGYIGKVELEGEAAERAVVQEYITRLKKEKPLAAKQMESFLLRLNDLPGLSFRTVLSPLEEQGAPEGAITLTLIPARKEGAGSVTFDNYGSRFLGPYEGGASYQTSFLPLQQTSGSLLASTPADELRYGALSHAITIAPDITLEMNGSYTHADPGYTLEPLDIRSLSSSLGISLAYQWIRQREENLSLKLMLDGKNTESDLLGTLLTRDHVRAMRAEITYDKADGWNGQNLANITVSRGLNILDASQKGDIDLSRAKATPDFTKLELSLTRLQGISPNWALFLSAAGQIASDPLYSSEEFGYGGQAFGRAYDASELTGEHGVSGSAELRYNGWAEATPVSIVPYLFYDAGTIWNKDAGQPDRASGSSAGMGLHFASSWNMTGNLGLAFPLTRDVATPIYGSSSRDPRLLLQISHNF